jgi:hypothetical protein
LGGNYAINYTGANLTITPAVLGVAANNVTQLYGAATPALTVSYSGFLNGDTAAVLSGAPVLTTAATNGSPAGTYVITNLLGTLTSTNYTFSLTNGVLTVAPASIITVTVNPQSRAYGAANPAPTVSYSGFLNGDTAAVISGAPVLSVAANATSVVGTYVITNQLGSLSASNYVFNLVNGALAVTPAPLTITAGNATKAYGQTVTCGSGSTQFTAGGLQNGESVGTVTLAASGGTAANAAVGSYTLTPSVATGGTFNPANYTIAYAPGTLTVTPAFLTITANAAVKGYGQTMNFGGNNTEFTSSGLQNGETIGSVTLAVGNNGGAATAVPGGYPITPSAATGGTFNRANYTITYAPGTLTVNPGVITVVPCPQTRIYGATNPVLTVSYSGFINGDTAAVINGAPIVSTGAGASSSVGSYTINIHAGTLSATNYVFNLQNGTMTITPAPLTVTGKAHLCKTYGLVVTFGSGSTLFTSSGLQNGEMIGTVTLTDSSNGGAATATVAGSPYSLTPSAATGGTFNPANYTITYAVGTLTVCPAALTVTALGQSKTYGQTLAFGPGSTLFTASGLENGETVGTVTLAVSNNGGAATAATGNYTITPGAATGGTFNPANYAITYGAGILAVTAQSGTSAVVVAAPTPVTINNPMLLRDGTVQLTFTGGDARKSYAVQASTDLSHWTTLTNVVAGTNGLPAFIDAGATNGTMRFYRTMTP